MSYIEIIQAYHGDAFVIHATKGNESGIIVVDGGPAQSRIKVLRRLEEIDEIDLMVLTHYDSDHISGLLTYIEQQESAGMINVKELWVNCAREIDMCDGVEVSYGQASKMADLLSELERNVKRKFSWKERICAGVERDLGFAKIKVIGPEPGVLEIRQEKYENAITTNVSYERVKKDVDVPLEELAKNVKMRPSASKANELANMSSMAFIVECDELRALLLGDSYPDAIEKELRKTYSEKNPLKLDVMKIAHHGSRNNISNTLLDIIDCQDYIISTNGGIGETRHPDREALANILCHPNRDKSKAVRLYFNYDIGEVQERTGVLLTEEEKTKYHCEIYSTVNKYPI